MKGRKPNGKSTPARVNPVPAVVKPTKPMAGSNSSKIDKNDELIDKSSSKASDSVENSYTSLLEDLINENLKSTF